MEIIKPSNRPMSFLLKNYIKDVIKIISIKFNNAFKIKAIQFADLPVKLLARTYNFCELLI